MYTTRLFLASEQWPGNLNAPLPVSSLTMTTLPGGPYLLPAMCHPVLLLIREGSLQLTLPPSQKPAENRAQTPPHSSGLSLPEAGLYGASTHPYAAHASAGTRLIMAAIPPGQLHRCFDITADLLINRFLPLAGLLPPALTHALFERLACAPGPTEEISACWWLLATLFQRYGRHTAGLYLPPEYTGQPLSEIAARFGLSPRQFERQFKRSYGQGLRAYRRQSRCSQMLTRFVCGQSAKNPPGLFNWADIACASGYFDQSHLIRDLQAFTGYTPGQLVQGLQQQNPALWPYRFQPAQIQQAFNNNSF